MSYKRTRQRRRLPMGDIAGTISTVADVTSDPYFAETVCHVQQLQQIEHGQQVQVCAETPDGYVGGVGLRAAMPAMRAYVYAQRNQWVYPAAIAAILGLPLLIGYNLGKGAR